MRKKLLFVFGLVLFLGLSLFLANQVQAKEVASFKGDNLGQIEVAVLREGAQGGWPVVVDDHLKVTGFFYPEQGIVTGNSGGDPVIIGDHIRIDGFLLANSGIVRGESGGDPVIIGDHLRVDGEISRPFGPVIVNDDLEVKDDVTIEGNLEVAGTISASQIDELISGQIKAAALKSTTWKGYVYDVTGSNLRKSSITVTFAPTSSTSGTFSSTPINFCFPGEQIVNGKYVGQTFTGNYKIIGNTMLAWNISPSDTGRNAVATMTISGTTISYTNYDSTPAMVIELTMQ